MTFSSAVVFVIGLCILFMGVFYLLPQDASLDSDTESDRKLRSLYRASLYMGPGLTDLVDATEGMIGCVSSGRPNLLRRSQLHRASQVARHQQETELVGLSLSKSKAVSEARETSV